jgi:hypothetical protein
MVCVPVDCTVRTEDSELPEVIAENNEDIKGCDGKCVDFNCGCHLLFSNSASAEFSGSVDSPLFF